MDAAAYVVAPLTSSSTTTTRSQHRGLDLTIDRPRSRGPRRSSACGSTIRGRAPGRTVPLKVLLRTYRGEEVVRTVPLAIPANATGSLSVMVSDGTAPGAVEQREARARRSRAACPADARAQQGAPQQHALRETARLRRRRRRQRRAAVVAAAVGARRPRRRSQQRQLQPAPQRDARRMGTADRVTPSPAPAADRSPSRSN